MPISCRRLRLVSTWASLLAWVPFGANAEEHVQLMNYYYGDQAFCFQVPLERARQLPRWAGTGEPPISRTQAVRIATKDLGLGATPHRIALNHVDARSGAKADVWYYVIEYEPSEKHPFALAVVLFDGKLVKSGSECSYFEP